MKKGSNATMPTQGINCSVSVLKVQENQCEVAARNIGRITLLLGVALFALMFLSQRLALKMLVTAWGMALYMSIALVASMCLAYGILNAFTPSRRIGRWFTLQLSGADATVGAEMLKRQFFCRETSQEHILHVYAGPLNREEVKCCKAPYLNYNVEG